MRRLYSDEDVVAGMRLIAALFEASNDIPDVTELPMDEAVATAEASEGGQMLMLLMEDAGWHTVSSALITLVSLTPEPPPYVLEQLRAVADAVENDGLFGG